MSTEHITDEAVRALYEDAWDEPWDVLVTGEALLEKAPTDRLAILQIMAEATGAIMEDLEEHEDNQVLYDDNDYGYFVGRLAELKEQIRDEYNKGETSEVFETWKAAEDSDDDDDDDDNSDDDNNLLNDINGDTATELIQDLAASFEDNPDGFIAVLDKFGELTYRDQVADYLTGYVQNAQLSLHGAGDSEDAGRIIVAYAKLMATGFAQGEHHFSAVATALAIAQLTNNDHVATVIMNDLTPEPLEHPTLAFNLACYAAAKGDRDKVLRYSKIALDLGKSKDQFRDDSDFEPFMKDPEFLALVS